MDFSALENVAALDDANYEAFVAWLKQTFADRFRRAKGDARQVHAVVTAYRIYCKKVDLTAGEYTDFLCVDTPNILELAGYSDAESKMAVEFFDART